MTKENSNIDRLLNSVGTETFVKYFYEFQKLDKQKPIARICNPCFTDCKSATSGKLLQEIQNEDDETEMFFVIPDTVGEGFFGVFCGKGK